MRFLRGTKNFGLQCTHICLQMNNVFISSIVQRGQQYEAQRRRVNSTEALLQKYE
jgi:hypothetical protein